MLHYIYAFHVVSILNSDTYPISVNGFVFIINMDFILCEVEN
jgi:hypothetical protein